MLNLRNAGLASYKLTKQNEHSRDALDWFSRNANIALQCQLGCQATCAYDPINHVTLNENPVTWKDILTATYCY